MMKVVIRNSCFIIITLFLSCLVLLYFDNSITKEKKEKVYRGESKVASFFKDSFAEFTLIDAIQVVLPVICMLAYVIIILAGGFKRIEIPYEFTGTLFGYDFELSNLALNWFESTHHEFFSAITLGFFQIILIVLGFLLDLVVHLIFLIHFLNILFLQYLYIFDFAIF